MTPTLLLLLAISLFAASVITDGLVQLLAAALRPLRQGAGRRDRSR